jgi:hypothetical protein
MHHAQAVVARAPLFLTAMLFGICLLLALVAPFMRYRIDARISLIKEDMNDTLRGLADSNALRYGVVEAVDATGRSLTVTLNTQTSASPHVRVRIAPSAYIAFQEMLSTDGSSFDSLSEPRNADFSDIHVGDRVLLRPQRDAAGKLSTTYLLFGNPL